MALPYKVRWSGAAQKDLESILDYIALENPNTALRLFHSIRVKASRLRTFPERGRLLPELAHIRGLPFRELVIVPWRLIYRVEKKRVEVLAFLDSRRDLEEILYERLSRIP